MLKVEFEITNKSLLRNPWYLLELEETLILRYQKDFEELTITDTTVKPRHKKHKVHQIKTYRYA